MEKLFKGFFRNPNSESLENDNAFTVDAVKAICKCYLNGKWFLIALSNLKNNIPYDDYSKEEFNIKR